MKKFFTFSIIFLIFINTNLPTKASILDKDHKQKFIEYAKNAEKRKNFDSVFFNYEKLLFYYPKDKSLMKMYAEFCERNKFYPKAIELYHDLYKLTSDKSYTKKIKKLEAKIHYAEKAPDIKIVENKEPQKKTETNTKPSKKPPKKIVKQKQKQKQKKQIKTAQKIIPQKPVITEENLMYNALKRKDFKEAEKLLTTLLLKFPNNKKYVRLRTDVALEQDDFQNAIIYLNQLDLTSQDYDTLAYCYYSLNDYDGAVSVAKKALSNGEDKEKWLKYEGDIYSIKKEYNLAAKSYEKLIKIIPKEEYYLKLTDFYLAQNDFSNAEKTISEVYKNGETSSDVARKYMNILDILQKPDEALEIAKNNNLGDTEEALKIKADLIFKDGNYTEAREIYQSILEKNPDFSAAQRGIVDSYIANAEDLSTLNELDKLPQNDEVKILKAKTYYHMQMYKNAKDLLAEVPQTDEVYKLQNDIQKARAYVFQPSYSLFTQKLSESFKLNSNKIGFKNSFYQDNLNIYGEYKIDIYSSGRFSWLGNKKYTNFTNELRGGFEGRITEKFAMKGDVGVKIFQNDGAMLLSDSWIKYYPNDKLGLKLGFYRNNVEQSYLSAVGMDIDGVFTGQVAENKVYSEFDYKLPKMSYLFGRGGVGLMAGQNLSNNGYWEGMLGLGKLFYYSDKNPYFKKVSADIVSYNAGYKYNLLDLYDSAGNLYGGYWSPKWFSANTLNLSVEGKIKNTGLAYEIGGFGGWQYSIRPVSSYFTWGAFASLNYNVTDYIDIFTQYRYFNYADVQRNQFIIGLNIRGFKRAKKS